MRFEILGVVNLHTVVDLVQVCRNAVIILKVGKTSELHSSGHLFIRYFGTFYRTIASFIQEDRNFSMRLKLGKRKTVCVRREM
jgi:hypothetical protein